MRVTVQMGHVPRTTGSTGTHREQEFNQALAPLIREGLERAGFGVDVMGADDPVPGGDVFVSLHCDGSSNPDRRGASVGYPDNAGRELAHAWKKAHRAHGYPGGWHDDNYTAALAGYYMWSRTGGYRWRFLAEHGTTTNVADERWLFSHLSACAAAHVDAIRIVTGHSPTPSTLPTEDDDMIPEIIKALYRAKHGNNYDVSVSDPGAFAWHVGSCLASSDPHGYIRDWVAKPLGVKYPD